MNWHPECWMDQKKLKMNRICFTSLFYNVIGSMDS